MDSRGKDKNRMDEAVKLRGAKFSVIVPVYRVEPYLRKCLDSIAGQTCQNSEIILADDTQRGFKQFEEFWRAG